MEFDSRIWLETLTNIVLSILQYIEVVVNPTIQLAGPGNVHYGHYGQWMLEIYLSEIEDAQK